MDYHKKQIAFFQKGIGEMFAGIPNIVSELKDYAQGDALLEEIKAFLACISRNTTPLVTGEKDAMRLTLLNASPL